MNSSQCGRGEKHFYLDLPYEYVVVNWRRGAAESLQRE